MMLIISGYCWINLTHQNKLPQNKIASNTFYCFQNEKIFVLLDALDE